MRALAECAGRPRGNNRGHQFPFANIRMADEMKPMSSRRERLSPRSTSGRRIVRLLHGLDGPVPAKKTGTCRCRKDELEGRLLASGRAHGVRHLGVSDSACSVTDLSCKGLEGLRSCRASTRARGQRQFGLPFPQESQKGVEMSILCVIVRLILNKFLALDLSGGEKCSTQTTSQPQDSGRLAY
jgi:hypothetical protein